MKKKPIRILVTAPLGVGGITSMMLNIQKNLDREKINFDYLVLHDRHEDNEDVVYAMGSRKLIASADDIRFKPFRMIIRWKRFYNVLKNNHIKIFHLNGGPSSDVVWAMIAKLAGVKHLTFHSHIAGDAVHRYRFSKELSVLLRPFMPMFIDDFWACSTLAAEFSFPKIITQNNKFTLIPNGINLERFIYDIKTRDDIRKKLELEENFVIGHAGRFNPQKNHDLLIDIFAEIYNSDSDARLLLLGIGELQDCIKKKVHKLGLDNVVIFYGASFEIEKLYQVMDVFVMPSLCEGLPVAGVEVQTSGMPLILSDTITREVAILETTEFISLKAPVTKWAQSVLKYKDFVGRRNCTNEMKQAGFNERDIARDFEEYYMHISYHMKNDN